MQLANLHYVPHLVMWRHVDVSATEISQLLHREHKTIQVAFHDTDTDILAVSWNSALPTHLKPLRSTNSFCRH